MKSILSLCVAVLLFSCSPEKSNTFNLQNIQSQNSKISNLQTGAGFSGEVLKIVPNNSNQNLTIWQGTDATAWENANYLVCEIWHDNDYSGVLNVEFFRKEKGADTIVTQSGNEAGDNAETPRMSAKIGVLPKLKTQVIFPLKHLDGQQIFMRRFPRQLKGTVLGNRMKPEEISKVAIRFGPWQQPHFTPQFEIKSVYLTKEVPQPLPPVETPIVDSLGQWAVKQWPGKIQNEKELKTLLEKQLASAPQSTFPENWSKYGGWKEKKFEATGFFRTHNDGKRWWLVDPDGYAFVSVGVDCIGSNASGVITGQEDLFAWLPDSTNQLFSQGYSDRGIIS